MAEPDNPLNDAYEFFRDALPDAAIIEPYEFGDVRDERLRAAGLALADVINRDGNSYFATYITEDTRHTAALFVIHLAEEIGMQPPGTHDRAVDAIISGDFDAEFGGYLP